MIPWLLMWLTGSSSPYLIWSLSLLLYAVAMLVTFLMYGYDKHIARMVFMEEEDDEEHRPSRIPEVYLLLSEHLGGAFIAPFVRVSISHKTRKTPFLLKSYLLLVCQLLLVGLAGIAMHDPQRFAASNGQAWVDALIWGGGLFCFSGIVLLLCIGAFFFVYSGTSDAAWRFLLTPMNWLRIYLYLLLFYGLVGLIGLLRGR